MSERTVQVVESLTHSLCCYLTDKADYKQVKTWFKREDGQPIE